MKQHILADRIQSPISIKITIRGMRLAGERRGGEEKHGNAQPYDAWRDGSCVKLEVRIRQSMLLPVENC